MQYEQTLTTIHYSDHAGDEHAPVPSEAFTTSRSANRRSLLTFVFVAFVISIIGLQFLG